MTTYFQLLLLNLLLIFGIWKLFQVDEVFGKAGDWMTKRIGDHWVKPLFDCPACMSSVWGTAFFVATFHVMPVWVEWWMLPLHCLVLCGAATIVTFLNHD